MAITQAMLDAERERVSAQARAAFKNSSRAEVVADAVEIGFDRAVRFLREHGEPVHVSGGWKRTSFVRVDMPAK